MLRSRVKSPAHLSLLCINVCETRNKIIKITFFKKSLQVFDFDNNKLCFCRMANDLNRIYHLTTKLVYSEALEKRFNTWLIERHLVPGSEHPTIEASFVECLQFLVAIEDNENASQNFDMFKRKVETLVETINAKKQ